MSKHGLGRGLNSLLQGSKRGDLKVEEISLKEISPNPNQPRSMVETSSFEELVSSVAQLGIIQPVVVRPKGLGYELVAGERRWRAAAAAGLDVVPAVVKTPTEVETLEIALVENIQRQNLNAVDEAKAFHRLIEDFGLTQAQVAKKVGKSRTAVTNTLRLLQLPTSIQVMIADGRVTSGHARALLGIDDREKQKRVADRVARDDLSVRQTETLVRLMQVSADKSQTQRVDAHMRSVAKEISRVLGANVRVTAGRNKTKLEIEFESQSELERIYALISGRAERAH